MSRKILIPIGAALCSLVTAVYPALAQGTAFAYQGRLNDGANPATGSYDVRCAIYDAARAGAQQGNPLTNFAAAVTHSLFPVIMDFGSPFPGTDRRLELAVRTRGDGAFTTRAPRQLITPTTYAGMSARGRKSLEKRSPGISE